jgi:hypothetical protein
VVESDDLITLSAINSNQTQKVMMVQLVAKKSENENFPNENLILSICQLIDNTYQIILKNVIEF